MAHLPEWWDDLLTWFLDVDDRRVPTNMAHAWRVNRYADEACTGGLCDFLSNDDRGFSHTDLRSSMRIIGAEAHSEFLEEAIAFLAETQRHHQLPVVAQMARSVAYDGLFRGLPPTQVRQHLVEITPDCPSELHDAVLAAAAYAVECDKHWGTLDEKFFTQEPEIRIRIAMHAEKHFSEWAPPHNA